MTAYTMTEPTSQNHTPASTEAAPPIRVLMVDDDRDLCYAVSQYMERNGITTAVEYTGEHVLARIDAFKPDLLILDVMLPGADGFEICRMLRAHSIKLPILMLTAKDEDFDQLLGLELGADIYLAKPVHPRILLAQVKAAIRRASGSLATAPESVEVPGVLRFGKLSIDGPNRQVTLAGERIKFSAAEFDLLWLLASNAGKVMSRDEILKKLRGLHYAGSDRSIDARLYRLRRRFGAPDDAIWKIKTVRPHGYMFCLEDW